MKKGSWLVRVKCVVEKELVCNDCTEKQAHDDPYSHCVDETEKGMTDYDVQSVVPNE